MKQLKEIMTPNVESVTSNTSVSKIAKKMKSLDIGVLPVVDENKILGIVTDRDIVLRAVANGDDMEALTAKDVMSSDVLYCYEDDSPLDAAKLMQQKQVRRILILDHNREICGIVSLGDLATELRDRKVSHKTLEKVSEDSGILSQITSGLTKVFLGSLSLSLVGAGIYWLSTQKGFQQKNPNRSEKAA